MTNSGDKPFVTRDRAADGRLFSPAVARNLRPIRDALAARFADARGQALEIGSGTGEHAAALSAALPHLTWTPSDPDPAARASIRAWRDWARTDAPDRVGDLNDPIDLDAAGPWPTEAGGPFVLIFAANIVHIAPWAVAEGLFRGAGDTLQPDGALVLYGPFAEQGRHVADSNARFDASLRARDPSWGVRDLVDLDAVAGAAGLRRTETLALPANNHLATWRRRR